MSVLTRPTFGNIRDKEKEKKRTKASDRKPKERERARSLEEGKSWSP
jgi:hypothetical protein